MFKNKLTLKIFAILIFSDILETFTHFCFKKSATLGASLTITNPLELFIFIKTAVFSLYFWLAMASVFSTFVLWSTVLSKIDLSIAAPIASSSYILVPLVSIIALGEKVSLLRWVGVFFILAGVIFVSKSAKKEEVAVE